jgi:predicted HTH domain antitoxin
MSDDLQRDDLDQAGLDSLDEREDQIAEDRFNDLLDEYEAGRVSLGQISALTGLSHWELTERIKDRRDGP